ncbi:hypothetical protein D3C78_717630 [compost metagenome]
MPFLRASSIEVESLIVSIKVSSLSSWVERVSQPLTEGISRVTHSRNNPQYSWTSSALLTF